MKILNKERMRKIKVILQMSKWLLYPRYLHLRLYTMYGTQYLFYLIKHPLLFINDINRYIEWCIMIDETK
jgi:hypothetical protein